MTHETEVTGATTSAAQAQRYAVANARLNNDFQKEFAQNAHQWEMQDLKNAGLNPALTATGGSGASASGGGSFGGSTGTASGNPFDIASVLVGMRNQTSATKSQNNLNDAQALLAIAQAENLPKELKIKAQQALAATITANASARNADTNYWNMDLGKKIQKALAEGGIEAAKKLLKKYKDDNKEEYHEPTKEEIAKGILF